MKRTVFLLTAVMLLTCTACHETPDSSAVDMTTAPELAGTMRSTAPSAEAPADDEDIPNLEPTKAWIDYGSCGIYSKNLPETEHIILTQNSQIYKIDTMVGGIEQRFFEVHHLTGAEDILYQTLFADIDADTREVYISYAERH